MARFVLLVTLFILKIVAENIEAAQIIQEPQNARVPQGDTIYFNCSFIGAAVQPLWTINGKHYYGGGFPPRHHYLINSQVLEVVNVQLSDNGSTYQCTIISLSSRVAVLTVYPAITTDITIASPVTDEYRTPFNTSLLISDDRDKYVTTVVDKASDCCYRDESSKLMEDWRVIVPVGSITLMIGVMATMLACISYKMKKRRSNPKDHKNDPIYEEIGSINPKLHGSILINTCNNEAYGKITLENVVMNYNVSYEDNNLKVKGSGTQESI